MNFKGLFLGVAAIASTMVIAKDPFGTEMMDKIADTYEEEVDNTVSALTSMIEPLMIVGTAVIALFMPLVKIIEKMG